MVHNVFALMDADRKFGPLKRLQGILWKTAYEQGLIQGQ